MGNLGARLPETLGISLCLGRVFRMYRLLPNRGGL